MCVIAFGVQVSNVSEVDGSRSNSGQIPIVMEVKMRSKFKTGVSRTDSDRFKHRRWAHIITIFSVSLLPWCCSTREFKFAITMWRVLSSDPKSNVFLFSSLVFSLLLSLTLSPVVFFLSLSLSLSLFYFFFFLFFLLSLSESLLSSPSISLLFLLCPSLSPN